MRLRSSAASIRYLPSLGLILTALLVTAGCATRAPQQTTEASSGGATAPADPAQWVGRWHGHGPASLTIMPSARGTYKVKLRNAQGVATRYHATAAGGRLYFQRLGKTVAVRPGRGSETDDPSLAGLGDCLLIVPEGGGYCRQAGTADALPLARGAYVQVNTACHAAQPADTLYFTGRAIARPGQNACKASLVGQQGMIFHLDDNCAVRDAASGANETVSVPNPYHMAVRTAGQSTTLYRYCATGLLPRTLQADAP